jgi:hypothetical protein
MKYLWSILLLCSSLLSQSVLAEPYLAARTGNKCSACHVNPTGGGMRTVFGNLYGQTGMVTKAAEKTDDSAMWTGNISEFLSIGGHVRGSANNIETKNEDSTFAFDFDEVLLFTEISLIANQVSFYIDQRMGPGSSSNREAFALLWNADRSMYVKAGRMFLPYGLRIEDDAAFIRQVPGINFTTFDDGVEAGLEKGNWTANFAITNGAAGGAETNRGKQFSLRTSYITPIWRVGGSFNFNNNDSNDRQMQNIFFTLLTGDVTWMAEYDFVIDKSAGSSDREQTMSLIEANYEFKKGHNVKLTLEGLDPDADIDNDDRTRTSLIWEFVPLLHTQFRTGYRKAEGIPQNNSQNTDTVFFQLNNFF